MNGALQLFPSLLGEAAAAEPGVPMSLVFVAIIIAITLGLFAYARRGYSNPVFKGPVVGGISLSGMAEQLYLYMEHFALGIIGPHGRKYITVLATYWSFIFVANVWGLFIEYTPTADFSLNLGMAIAAVFYVQYEGIRHNGIWGHFKHFAGPKLTGIMVLVTALIFLIEIISETMKMLSLSLRLYGNIHGGHEVVSKLNDLGQVGGWNVPIGGLLIPIKLLTCVVQALVFTLLLAVYLGLVTHHEEEPGGQHSASDETGRLLEGNPHALEAHAV